MIDLARYRSIAFLQRRAENVSAALLSLMFAAFIIQIVFRYVLNWPVGWTVEVCLITWIWVILWGSSLVLSEREEIRFDIVYGSVSPRTRRVFEVITSSVLVALYVISLPAAYDYVTFMKIERSSYSGIRLDIIFSVYILFAVASIARYTLLGLRAIAGRDAGEGATP